MKQRNYKQAIKSTVIWVLVFAVVQWMGVFTAYKNHHAPDLFMLVVFPLAAACGAHAWRKRKR